MDNAKVRIRITQIKGESNRASLPLKHWMLEEDADVDIECQEGINASLVDNVATYPLEEINIAVATPSWTNLLIVPANKLQEAVKQKLPSVVAINQLFKV